MSELWAVHLSNSRLNGTMWPAQFYDENSLRTAWNESSPGQGATFSTMFHHLERLFKNWQEESLQDEGMYPCKPANYFSLIKHERLEEFIDSLGQPGNIELLLKTINLVPLSALLLYALRQSIPPELVWFTPGHQAQGMFVDTNRATFSKCHSELQRLCPTIKASDGGDRFAFAARDALSYKEIFVKQTIVPSSEDRLKSKLESIGRMHENECCFAFPINVQATEPRGEDDVSASARNLVNADLVPMFTCKLSESNEDRARLPLFLAQYDEMWKEVMTSWKQPDVRAAARQNSGRANRFKVI